MRQIICEKIRLLWLHLLLLMPFARIHHIWTKITKQSQEEYLTACQSLLVHTLQAAPLPCACFHSVKPHIFSERMQWRTSNHRTTKQWENCPSLLCQQQFTRQRQVNRQRPMEKSKLKWKSCSAGRGFGCRARVQRRGRWRDLEVVLFKIVKLVHSLLNPTDSSFNLRES